LFHKQDVWNDTSKGTKDLVSTGHFGSRNDHSKKTGRF